MTDKVGSLPIDCNYCGAKAGKPCIRYDGEVRPWAHITRKDAWQNAAESLPAPVVQEDGEVVTLCEEHGCRDCSVCFHDEPLLPAPGNDGFQEWLMANSEGMEGEDDAESLMHVAWRAALLKAASVPPASANSPAIPAKEEIAVEDQPCEWYGQQMGLHNWIVTPDGWKRCTNCKREYKPEIEAIDKPTKEREQVIPLGVGMELFMALQAMVRSADEDRKGLRMADEALDHFTDYVSSNLQASQPSDQPTQKEAQGFEEWWSARPETNFGWTKRIAHEAWNAALSHKEKL